MTSRNRECKVQVHALTRVSARIARIISACTCTKPAPAPSPAVITGLPVRDPIGGVS